MKEILVGLGLTAGSFVLIVLLVTWAKSAECAEINEETSFPTRYRFWSGCYVKLDTGWVPKRVWVEARVTDTRSRP